MNDMLRTAWAKVHPTLNAWQQLGRQDHGSVGRPLVQNLGWRGIGRP